MHKWEVYKSATILGFPFVHSDNSVLIIIMLSQVQDPNYSQVQDPNYYLIFLSAVT